MSSLRAEMTHGDKAKAKTGKSSQTSAKKASSKAVERAKAGTPTVKADKNRGKKQQAIAEKPARPTGGAGKNGSAQSSEPKTKGRGEDAPNALGFANSLVGAAFKRAIKKYPNAFRKLTD